MATRKTVCKKAYVVENGIPVGIEFTFTNGKRYEVLFADLPEGLGPFAMAHGYTQTLGDAYSASGGDAAVAEGLFLARLEGLRNGEWSSRGTGAGVQADNDLAAALAEVTGKDLDVAREQVAGADKAWKDARRKHPEVMKVLARIEHERKLAKAEKAEETLELDELL